MDEIIEAIRSSKIKDVFFGSRGFSLCDESNINELQLGYSIQPDGSDLTGEDEGDWQKNWIVIGNDADIGDPFFVDTLDPLLPVYTAMHGMGEWNSEPVATSLLCFLEALMYLKTIGKQDFARIEPDESPIIGNKELAIIENNLCNISG